MTTTHVRPHVRQVDLHSPLAPWNVFARYYNDATSEGLTKGTPQYDLYLEQRGMYAKSHEDAMDAVRKYARQQRAKEGQKRREDKALQLIREGVTGVQIFKGAEQEIHEHPEFDPAQAEEISMDHLLENPSYYSKK
jgi:hypothetical protein